MSETTAILTVPSTTGSEDEHDARKKSIRTGRRSFGFIGFGLSEQNIFIDLDLAGYPLNPNRNYFVHKPPHPRFVGPAEFN